MCKILLPSAMCLSQAILFSQVPISEPKTPIATLPEVRLLMALAKKNNPDFATAQSRTRVEYARIGPAGALPDPQVSFGIHKSPLQHVRIASSGEHALEAPNLYGLSGALPGMTEYSMSVGQGIPWPGKLAAREGVAQQGFKRSEIGVFETALALESDVLASCLELLVVQARIELLESQMNYWISTEEIIKARLDQGGSNIGEAIQAMQEQSRLRLRLLESENQMQDQKDLINQLVVRQSDSSVELESSVFNIDLPEPPKEAELLNDLKARNPEWLSSLVDRQIADAAVHSARKDRYPDLWTGVGISRAGSMPMAWRAEIGIALPIWSGRKQNKAVERALAERYGTESAQASLALALATKSRERARAWKLADATIKLYEKELIPQGEAALKILIARFQNGGTSFGALVETLNALLKDQENRLDAIAQIHRISILQHRASLEPVSKTVAPNSPRLSIATAIDSGSTQMSAH